MKLYETLKSNKAIGNKNKKKSKTSPCEISIYGTTIKSMCQNHSPIIWFLTVK